MILIFSHAICWFEWKRLIHNGLLTLALRAVLPAVSRTSEFWYSWFWKFLNVRPKQWVQYFQKYSCKNWYNNWYLHLLQLFITTDNLPWWSPTHKVTWPLITWFWRSRNKPEPLYLHYHSAYGHQTWKSCDYPWAATTHNVALMFGYFSAWRSVTN